jgi:addiction module HigA family antidote
MHNPPHPGEVLRELCLAPLNLTVTKAASALGVSRKTLSSILNGRTGISAEMAVRLSMAFGTSAESWLQQQVQYDLWQVQQQREAAGSQTVGGMNVVSCEARLTPSAGSPCAVLFRGVLAVRIS